MGKDPAVLFYTGDFLNGCVDLTFEERGQYITLLCLQHQKGHLSEKTIRLCVGSVSVDVLKKFHKDDNGDYFNERMEAETRKRAQYIDSRRDNGAKGGRPKKPYAKPYGKAKQNHSEDDNRDENINGIKDYISPLFLNSFNKWMEYKKGRKESYKTLESEIAFYNKLIKLSNNNPTTAAEIIEESMANNWSGIFPLKNNGNKVETQQTYTIKPIQHDPIFNPAIR